MEAYDYIIVGAGSCGCVLAARLSENPRNKVLLIESGPASESLLVGIPRGFGKLMSEDSPRAWFFPAQKPAGLNQPEYYVRGRMLGGSSAINGMVYMRGLSTDFDEWNCRGWGWPDMLRCFREIECHDLGEAECRGGRGPLRLTSFSYRQPLCDAVIEAGAELGLPKHADLNDGDTERVGYHTRNIWRGWRQSAAKVFLDPARRRPNLRIETGVDVDRVIVEDRRAVGIRGRKGNEPVEYRAGRDVILSAGAINTPKLLQLSGIGPAEELIPLGVEVIADNTAIGRNLADHRMMTLQFDISHGSDNNEFHGWRLARNLAHQLLLGGGPLSRVAFEVGGYAKSRPDLARPDIQFLVAPFRTQRTTKELRMTAEPGASGGFYQMRPQSRGRLIIRSKDPRQPPLIEPNFLSASEDRRVAVDGVKFIRRLFSQPALQGFHPTEDFPGRQVGTDDEILDTFLRSCGSAQHLSGTCRMGEDPHSAVDSSLRVRGVDGLRVMDISVMPAPTSGNTNAPAMAMAWRAAEVIQA